MWYAERLLPSMELLMTCDWVRRDTSTTRPYEPGRLLVTFRPDRQITCGQPDLLVHLVLMSWLSDLWYLLLVRKGAARDFLQVRSQRRTRVWVKGRGSPTPQTACRTLSRTGRGTECPNQTLSCGRPLAQNIWNNTASAVSCLNDREDDCLTLWGRQTCDEV